MKKISCVQMGGPADCKFVVTGNTAAEIVEAGSVHVMAEHPEIMKMMAEMSEEKKEEWFANFKSKFDSIPEEV